MEKGSSGEGLGEENRHGDSCAGPTLTQALHPAQKLVPPGLRLETFTAVGQLRVLDKLSLTVKSSVY